ncbi:MAG: single-stranded DNA-binding protein [Candidatus Brocadiaceae bacterium]|nr:single-stranded DNA-binding protein [Candidatus Brocadiaceae bacterium]
MSGSLNKVILIGNLGKDPEIKTTNDGREIANFSIATRETWKDKTTGEKKDKTEWHRVVCFNEGLTRVIKSYVKKGSKIYIEGQLQTRKWTDQDKQEKYTTEVVLQNYNSSLILLDSKGENAPQGANNASVVNKPEFKNEELDDEIPF